MLGDDLHELLGTAIPADHARQALSEHYIPALAAAGPRVIDLGCGAGDSVEQFRTLRTDLDWLGVDVEWSPEVASRTRSDARFETFDGIHIPAGDGSADSVYCKQVLEHVRHPAPLVADVARVLRPGGLLAGSTSQLEPFHSLSTRNLTPYGLALLLEDAGLRLDEVRPSIDGLAIVVHRALGMRSWTRRWWARPSPLNRALDLVGRVRHLDAARVNAAKLVLCGQYAFLAHKPGESAP